MVAVIALGLALMLQGYMNFKTISYHLEAINTALQFRTTEGNIEEARPQGARSRSVSFQLPPDIVEIRDAPETPVPLNSDVSEASDTDSDDYVWMSELYNTPRQPPVRMAETVV